MLRWPTKNPKIQIKNHSRWINCAIESSANKLPAANAVKVQGRSESSREGGEGGVGNEGGLINAI